MTYTFNYTERNLGKGTQFETKALLYLLGMDKDNEQIKIAFIDCFNDISGTNDVQDRLWDIQSKGIAKISPGKIGSSLITLYVNYKSGLKFIRYILFLEKQKDLVVVNKDVSIFDINNFDIKSKKRIEKGLEKELLKRFPQLKNDTAMSKSISEFLNLVEFVIDTNEPHQYVQRLTKFKTIGIKSDEFYNSVFRDIQDKQCALKLSMIEGKTIGKISDALGFNRHITSKAITQLVINRIIGVDLFVKRGIPISFYDEVKGKKDYEVKEILENCNSAICRVLFDKNKKLVFWMFLEQVLHNIENNKSVSAREVYQSSLSQGFDKSEMAGLPGIYFVSLVMEGFNQ